MIGAPSFSASCSIAGPQPTARRPSDDDRQLEASRARPPPGRTPASGGGIRRSGRGSRAGSRWKGSAPSAISVASTSEGSARCTARCCWPARPTKLRRSATSWPGWMQLALWARTEPNSRDWSTSWNSQWPTCAVGTSPVMSEQRHAVEIGVDHAAERVERAGARGGDADPELAGQPAVGAGGHRRGVLVAHQHPAHRLLPLERGEERHQRRAGIAVDVPDPERAEEGDDVVRDVHLDSPIPRLPTAAEVAMADSLGSGKPA